MKTQKTLDKLLKDKLEGAEMAPPPMLFNRVLEQIELQAEAIKPAWYRRPALLRVAAAVSLLAVSATLVLNEVYRPELQPDLVAQQYDSVQQQLLDDRLRDLQAMALAEAQQVDTEINQVQMQPRQQATRLEDMNHTLATASETRLAISVAPMPLRDKANLPNSIFSKSIKGFREVPAITQADLQLAEADAAAGSEEAGGRFSALRRSYSQLSDGSMFDLAKEKISDLTSRDHYVSFNLGRYEIGQTIPLSRLRSQEDENEE